MNHFDLSLIGLIRVAFAEDVNLRLDGERQATRYRMHDVANLPIVLGKLLVNSGKATQA